MLAVGVLGAKESDSSRRLLLNFLFFLRTPLEGTLSDGDGLLSDEAGVVSPAGEGDTSGDASGDGELASGEGDF